MAYERQYYTNGDVLDARQMNHMETGIKENSDNIDKLSEDIATKASAIKETASGETIVATDSDEQKPLGLAIDGKSEQNQYSGKNLLKNTAVDKTANGLSIKVDEEKRFSVNGTSIVLSAYDVGEFTVKTGETYILTGCPIGGSVSSYRLDVRKDAVSGLYDNNIIDYGSGCSFTATEDITLKVFMRYDVNYTFNNIVFEPMIRLATVTDGTYEPYCGGIPSPNPSYPQEIRNIGVYDEASGKYAVEVKGNRKNLYKNSQTFEGFENLYGYDSNYKETYNGLVVKKRAYPWSGAHLLINVKKGENYTFSGFVKTTCDIFVYVRHKTATAKVDNEEKEIKGSGEWQRVYLTFTVTESGTLAPRIESATDGEIYICGYQLEFGSVMTDYEPWEETKVTVLLDEPLRKEDKAYWNGGSKVRVDRYRDVKVINKSTRLDTSGKLFHVGYFEDVVNVAVSTDVIGNLCNEYAEYSLEQLRKSENGVCQYLNDFYVRDNRYSTVEEFSAYLAENPFEIEVALATPITEEIDIDLDGLSMFYPTTIISNDCNANMEVTYIADTKAYIDKKFAELATAMV